jgi:hypothetical protein
MDEAVSNVTCVMGDRFAALLLEPRMNTGGDRNSRFRAARLAGTRFISVDSEMPSEERV